MISREDQGKSVWLPVAASLSPPACLPSAQAVIELASMDAQDAPAAVQPAAKPEEAREHHKSSKHHKKHKRHHKHDHKDHKERKRRKLDHKGADGREPGSPEEGELLPGSAAAADAVQLPNGTNQLPR